MNNIIPILILISLAIGLDIALDLDQQKQILDLEAKIEQMKEKVK